jgi:hypothetical protein
MLRNRRTGLADLLKAPLGDDDRMFKLAASPAGACDF